MAIITDSIDKQTIRILRSGGVSVLRTDTLYGVVAQADHHQAVDKIYRLKTRHPDKSPIVLISSFDQLFDSYDAHIIERLKKLWPGKNSVILPSQNAPEWITRGNGSVAYRLPDNAALIELIDQTGPLVAPSANPEGQAPAMSIGAARRYFGDAVDCYIDGGEVTDATPSKLFRMWPDRLERLR